MANNEEINKQIEAIDSMIADLVQKRMELVKLNGSAPIYSDIRKNYIINKIGKSVDSNWFDYYSKIQNQLFAITELYQRKQANKYNPFLKDSADCTPYKDEESYYSYMAALDAKKYPDLVINAVPETLNDEQGKPIAYKTIYNVYNDISNSDKVSYAEDIAGNEDFKEAVYNWLNINNELHMPHKVVATSGSTGALQLAFCNCLNDNQCILIPETGNKAYELMANEANLYVEKYDLTNKDNNIDLTDMMVKGINIIKKQRKLVLVVNDPCQNPMGCSMSDEDWQKFIIYLNKVSEFGEVVVINDIAYIDYGSAECRSYLRYLNNLNNNIVFLMAFSCSNTFSVYGSRLGASIILCNDNKQVESIYNTFYRSCACLWGSINNSMQKCIAKVLTNHRDEFIAEKNSYVALLQKRAEIFINQSDNIGLPLFPYSDGYFISVNIEDEQLLSKCFYKLIDNHIYTLKFTKGLRISICALTSEQCMILPLKIREILKECANG